MARVRLAVTKWFGTGVETMARPRVAASTSRKPGSVSAAFPPRAAFCTSG